MFTSFQPQTPHSFYSTQKPLPPHQSTDLALTKFEEDFERNKWTAPDCNHFEMLQKIKMVVNGHGGIFDQSFFYFDSKGAENWLAISGTQDYQLNTKHDIPFEQLSNAIYHHFQRSSFDKDHIRILGLGCGDGQSEIKLVQRLLDRMPQVCIHLYLLDNSPSLLNLAYHNAVQVFAKKPQIKITVLEANFENLSSYQPIINMVQQSNHQVILTFFGYTFGNLSNERVFVRNALRVFKPQTLFLVDVLLAIAPTNDVDAIMKKDTRLSGQAAWQETAEHTDFLEGPLREYRQGTKKITFSYSLDYSTCFEGSYAVEIRALINHEVPFTLFRIKRYDPIKLGDVLLQERWASVQGFRYGNVNHPRMLYLTHKV